MAYDVLSLDSESFDDLAERMKRYGDEAEAKVNEVLHGFGGERVKSGIQKLLPESGRTWKGKKTAAKRANPFETLTGSLSVTIASKSGYGYLYFPDDGTNTKRHAGEQQFMKRGAEDATSDILERCVAALTEDF